MWQESGKRKCEIVDCGSRVVVEWEECGKGKLENSMGGVKHLSIAKSIGTVNISKLLYLNIRQHLNGCILIGVFL